MRTFASSSGEHGAWNSGKAGFGNRCMPNIASRGRPIDILRSPLSGRCTRWPALYRLEGTRMDPTTMGRAAGGRHRPRGSGDARADHAHRRRALDGPRFMWWNFVSSRRGASRRRPPNGARTRRRA